MCVFNLPRTVLLVLFKYPLRTSTIRKLSAKHYHYTPRRALLYVPGNDAKKLQKALKTLKVDCIAMDCEDGVAISQKEAARSTIRSILDSSATAGGGCYDLGVRLNAMDSGLCVDDMKAVLSAKHLPDTILLPKVDRSTDLISFSKELSHYDLSTKINLVIYIESALAFVNLKEICETARDLSKSSNCKFSVTSLVFGSDDFCASIGATRTELSNEILYARQKLVLYAKAFDFQAIDMVYIKFKDLTGLKQQSDEGARMGYTGKQVIHPDQVPIVQDAFLPSQNQIAWALGLIKAFDEHQKSGKGAFTFMGNMIDMPTMKQAQNVIELINFVKK